MVFYFIYFTNGVHPTPPRPPARCADGVGMRAKRAVRDITGMSCGWRQAKWGASTSWKIIKIYQKLPKLNGNQWKYMIDFRSFLVIFVHFRYFPMRPLLPTWPAPTRMMHHPSSNIDPWSETGEAQVFRGCLGIKKASNSHQMATLWKSWKK